MVDGVESGFVPKSVATFSSGATSAIFQAGRTEYPYFQLRGSFAKQKPTVS